MHDCDPASSRSLRILKFMVSAQTPCTGSPIPPTRNGGCSRVSTSLVRQPGLFCSSSKLGFLIVRCKIRRVRCPVDLTAHMQQSVQAHRREWPATSHGGGRQRIHCASTPTAALCLRLRLREPRAAPAKSLAPILIEVRISLMHVWWVGGYVGG